MIAVNFYSPKGGVGTTTIASLFALDMSSSHYVNLVSNDTESICAIFGSADNQADSHPCTETKINHGLTVSAKPTTKSDFVIIDSRAYLPAADVNVLVVQNTYLCLRRAIHSKFDLAVAHMNPDHAMSHTDVCHVLMGSNAEQVRTIQWAASTARAMDAGMPNRILKNDDYQEFSAALKQLTLLSHGSAAL